MYVVFEGPDGAGKTTAVAAVWHILHGELRETKISAVREPSDRPLGRAAYNYLASHSPEGPPADPYVAALSMVAQRKDLLGSLDFEDRVVLSDRSFLTTYVYQDSVDRRILDWLHGFDHGQGILRVRRVRIPDLVVFLKVDPTTTLERAKARGREIFSDAEILRVAEAYDRVVGSWNHLHPAHQLQIFELDTTRMDAEEVARRAANKILQLWSDPRPQTQDPSCS